jgi:transposase-like protein
MAEKKSTAEATVKNIRRNIRKKYSAEEKIRIVIEGLRGDLSIVELCRREGINQNSYSIGRKSFWKPGSSAWLATPSVKPPAKKSKNCGKNSTSSNSWWRSCP